MAQFRTLGIDEARSRLKGRTAGSAARARYREAIANLDTSYVLEFELDPGEGLRSLKLNVSRAAQEVGRQVEYGVSAEGTLLVWLRDKPRRTRRTKAARAPE